VGAGRERAARSGRATARRKEFMRTLVTPGRPSVEGSIGA
jgi:hypothetical protein